MLASTTWKPVRMRRHLFSPPRAFFSCTAKKRNDIALAGTFFQLTACVFLEPVTCAAISAIDHIYLSVAEF